MRIYYFLAAVALLLVNATRGNSQVKIEAQTHSCEGQAHWGMPACEAAWLPNTSAIFLARATEVRDEDVPIILDGQPARTPKQYVTFEVREAFVGVQERAVTVISAGDLCGFGFSKGHNYLVYGRRLPTGEVYVSISSSTKWEKDAVEDLKYLRSLPTVPPDGSIYGSVFRHASDEIPGKKVIRKAQAEAGQKVEIQGEGRTLEVMVDSKGDFKLAGLAPGRYTVTVKTNEKVVLGEPFQKSTVDVAPQGCTRLSYWIDPFAEKE